MQGGFSNYRVMEAIGIAIFLVVFVDAVDEGMFFGGQ